MKRSKVLLIACLVEGLKFCSYRLQPFNCCVRYVCKYCLSGPSTDVSQGPHFIMIHRKCYRIIILYPKFSLLRKFHVITIHLKNSLHPSLWLVLVAFLTRSYRLVQHSDAYTRHVLRSSCETFLFFFVPYIAAPVSFLFHHKPWLGM